MEQTNDNFSKGHTQIPHWLFHCLLLMDLSERDWKVTMLLIRLTLGCQKRWAKLRQCDLKAVGIKENHAKEVLIRLLEQKVIVLNEKINAYAGGDRLYSNILAKYSRTLLYPNIWTHLSLKF